MRRSTQIVVFGALLTFLIPGITRPRENKATGPETFSKAIAVQSPLGGESWVVGSSHDISWVTIGTVGFVTIGYSGGTIAASIPNTGKYSWTIPNKLFASCKVRVSEASDPAVYGESGVFSIVSHLNLTSPNGGECWEGGSSHNITWTTTGTIANVRIEYLTPYEGYQLLVDSIPNMGSYSWTVPHTPFAGCLVRVSDAANVIDCDMSDAVFSIVAAPALTVTSPNGGESWIMGLPHNITWTSTGTIADVKIELSTDSGASYTLVNALTANTGSYPWTVPNSPAAACLVRISDASDSAVEDVSNAVFTITAAAFRKDDLLGTWAGQGVYYRNSDTGGWTQLASPATKIAAGDLDGDGIDDLLGIWPSQGGVWVKYSESAAWALLSSTADGITAADMNGDGRAELLGTWTGQGVYWRDNASGVWTQLATPATKITAGDLDGDGIADLIGIWPSLGGVWVNFSQSGAWVFLSSTADWIAVGDMNGDGRDDLLGSWMGQGVYYRDSMTGQWVALASPATIITAGDFDGDGIDDVLGIWPMVSGVWVNYSNSRILTNLATTADWIAAGRMRSADGQASHAGEELSLPMGGTEVGPLRTAGYMDLSANSPGRDDFAPIIEKNLRPEETKTTMSFVARIPGPGEPGFRCILQNNVFPARAGTHRK